MKVIIETGVEQYCSISKKCRRDWACPCPKNGGMSGQKGLVMYLPRAFGQGQAQSLRENFLIEQY